MKRQPFTPVLLSRDQFREAVFERDNGRCVVCGDKADDAHHLIERRCWDSGGYFLENGASVCEPCHLKCEMTLISVEELRHLAGIDHIVVPDHLYPDERYDKWGNTILDNGMRTRGELFFDESVQKVLREGQVLDLFTHLAKYPRTYHVPWSPGINDDDRVMHDMSGFEGEEVVVTLKMDGENTSLYSSVFENDFHARSVDGMSHPQSQSMAKSLHARFAHEIPYLWRLNVENMYAKHSIAYNDLDDYLYGFMIWNHLNVSLSYDDTLTWFELLGITPARELYRGIYNEDKVRALAKDLDWEKDEGYVLKKTRAFSYGEFHRSVVKYVREGHVQTRKHWKYGQRVVPNGLSERGRKKVYG